MTAEEFLNKQDLYVKNKHAFPLGTGKIMQQIMIEFAKYHVQKSSEELRQGLIEDRYMNEDDKLIDLTRNIK